MNKMRMIVAGFGLLLILMIMGCGDDKCPSCPDQATFPGHVRGSLILNPGAVIQMMEVYGNGAVAPNLDSVKVGDSLVNKSSWSLFVSSSLADAHWAIFFGETGNAVTYMYEQGDTATVGVWGEGRSSSCRLKVIDPNQTVANVTNPAWMADTINPGEADTVFWNKAEYADYYAVMLAWQVYSGGSGHYIFSFHYATDTSFIVTGAMQPDSLINFDVVVTPFTGPDPRSGRGNWTGTLLDGVLYSFGGYDYTTIVIRPPVVPAGVDLPRPVEKRPEWSSGEIVGNLYKQYAK
jgi:hypothetical protein